MEALKILVVDDEKPYAEAGKGFPDQKKAFRFWKQEMVRKPWIFFL